MFRQFYGPFFTTTQKIIRIFFPKFTIENIPTENTPYVYVSHHQNLFGPFVVLLWFPIHLHCWMLHVFLEKKACYHHYANYTFSKRFGWPHILSKIISYPISCIIPRLLNSGKGIPVYRGSLKITNTFRKSVEVLKRGENVIIFPDVEYSDSSAEVKSMYKGFLYIEKYFYQATGKHIGFVPLYASKKQKKIIAGEPVYFRDGIPFKAEQKRVIKIIEKRLNDLAYDCGDLEKKSII